MLLTHDVPMKIACKVKVTCPTLKSFIESVLLSSLGCESGGFGAAHAIHNGLSVLEETHHFWHSKKIAIGVLTSLFMNNRPAQMKPS